jgi:hypothetical protein
MKVNDHRHVRVEDLLGRRVRTRGGRVLGRIEEIRAERVDDDVEVTEYHVGTGAMLERLGLVSRLLGRHPHIYVVGWQQLDLTSPLQLRLTCDESEIERKRR